MDYAVVAGHNDIIPGASGNGYQEHIVARQIKDRVIFYLRQLGETAHDCTDEVGRNKTQVWMNAADNCNREIGKNGFVIAIHLNAGGGSGTEVFDWKGTQKAKCQSVAKRLAKDFNWPVRGDGGWKNGDWIGLIKEADAPVIYLEVCFIDSITDITKLTRNIDVAAVGIVEEITGKKVSAVSSAGQPAAEIKEEDNMDELFNPSAKVFRNAVSTVLMRFEKKDPPLDAEWRDKANARELTISDAVGLLFVAIERGYITGK